MPIFHLHSQHIGRSNGRSAVAASAYRSASLLVEEIIDKATGVCFEQIHDYTNKSGVVFSEVIAPDASALWMTDRQKLWNMVQNKFDTRRDAVFSQEIDLALPVEFSQGQNLELLKEFVHDTFIKEGIIVDTNMHYDNPENPHAHLMLSTREIVWDADINDYTFGNKVRFWDTKEFLVQVRRSWAGFINEHLEMHGFDMEVSHLSYQSQGIDLMPGIKEGLGGRVQGSDRTELNKDIRLNNVMRIQENPELIIDILRKDRAVFTREDIAKELFKTYAVAREVDSDLKLGTGQVDSPKQEYNDIEISKYASDLAKVMASDRLVCLGSKDLEGRVLYTSRVRYELEQDLLRSIDILKYGEGGFHKQENASGELFLKDAPRYDRSELLLKSEIDNRAVVRNHCLDISMEDLDKKDLAVSLKDKAFEMLGMTRRCSKNLSEKQKEVVLGVLNGADISVVEGLPGAGKTFVMREIARQYKKAGYNVIGIAVSASAAKELGSVAGIRSMSITKFRHEIERMRGRDKNAFAPSLSMNYWQKGDEIYDRKGKSLLSNRTVLIGDEASMIDLTEMHFIMSEVKKSGAKPIFLGDRGQLSSAGISGAFEMVATHVPPLRLDEVRRQTLEEHREATKLLSRYKVADAIDIYRKTGVFKFGSNGDEARGELIRDFVAEYIGENANTSGVVALSYTNDEVVRLNDGIRDKLKESGVVYGDEVLFDTYTSSAGLIKKGFARGDRVLFRKNNKWLGVFNGDTGTVVDFGKTKDGTRDTISVRLDTDQSFLGLDVPNVVTVDNHFYKSMNHGFAVTIANSQGRTYSKVFALLDEYIGFHSFNVMVTRHIEALKVYLGYEVLENELYKKISLDPKGAKEIWNIKSDRKDIDSQKYAALVALAQKKDNRSISEDWRNLAFSHEGVIVSEYIAVKGEAIKLSQTIDSWVEQGRMKGEGRKAQDHEMYSELQASLGSRRALASQICDDIDVFSKVLTQTGINYNTIEKHAGRGKYKYFFERKSESALNSIPKGGVSISPLREIEGFASLLDSCRALRACDIGPLFESGGIGVSKAKDLIVELQSKTRTILESFDEKSLEVANARLAIDEAHKMRSDAKLFVKDGSDYLGSHIKLFLEKTYKNNPEEILEKWSRFRDELLEEGKTQGIEQKESINIALAKINKNPQLLGALKGVGLGSVLAFGPTRFRATVNMQYVHAQLEKYEDYRERMPEIEQDLKYGKYDEKIFEATANLHKLEKQNVTYEIEKFVREIHSMASAAALSSNQARASAKAIVWAKDEYVSSRVNFYNEILEDKSGEIAVKYEKLQTEKKIYSNNKNSTYQERVSFEDVSRNMSPSLVEEIFRSYAHSINPDGKIEKKGSRISAGSLGMDLKTGLWHRFSTGDGGNIFNFVREAKGGDIVDALEIVAGHAGIRGSDNSNKVYNIHKTQANNVESEEKLEHKGPVNEWIPYRVVPKGMPEFSPEEHLPSIMCTNEFGGLYTYRDQKGDVIGHTIRLIAKDGSKQVLPVSYCRNEALSEGKGEDAWRLKGFEAQTLNVGGISFNTSKPIYGLEKLYITENKNKPVLIVEGEKTAEKAHELFPDYVVISWLGGTSSADKVNWDVLKGKEVVIWPDNDIPGLNAARVIADKINGNIGGIGKCAIVNPSALSFMDKDSQERKDITLQHKWDLADELPKGLSLENLEEVLATSIEGSKTLDSTENLVSTIHNEENKRIIWQNRSAGLLLSQLAVKSISAHEIKWNTMLGSKESLAYMKYAEARSISETPHEFLGLEHGLYKETLVQVALGSKMLLEKPPEDINIPELLRSVSEKYEERRANFTDHIDCSQQHIGVLASISKDKAELMGILTRDVLLLHKLQLESGQAISSSIVEENQSDKAASKSVNYKTVLCDVHKEVVADDIYNIVHNYYIPSARGMAPSKLEDKDRIAIATLVDDKINRSDWWKKLAETRLEIGSQSNILDTNSSDNAGNHRGGFAEIEGSFGNIFKEIKEFDPEYNLIALKEELLSLKCSLRDDVLKAKWVAAFKAYVSPQLDAFTLSKAKAKNLPELIQIMDKERKYCAAIKDAHPNAVQVSYNKEDDNRIMAVTMHYRGDAKFADNLKQDASNISKFGIVLEEEEFAKIKNSDNHKDVADKLYAHCREHAIDQTHKNLESISEHGYCRSGDTRFTNKHSYLKHEINRGEMHHYLKDTVHEDSLHKMDDHIKIIRTQRRELRLEQMQKNYGMSMGM